MIKHRYLIVSRDGKRYLSNWKIDEEVARQVAVRMVMRKDLDVVKMIPQSRDDAELAA